MIECPNCGGNLKFYIPLQRMYCKFCDSNFDPYDFDSKEKDGIESKDYETTIFTCPECGGEIESTDNETTGFCPFCGGSTIFYSRLSKEKKPDYVIPFSKTKDDCKEAYMKAAKRAFFLPKEYRDEKYIDGFRGIYMPYWSYDMTQDGPVKIKGKKSHRSGDYIIHEHYDITGNLDCEYDGLSFDASSSFSDDISEKIAPFDVKKEVPFTAGFLSGFYSDRADVSRTLYKSEARAFAVRQTTERIKDEKALSGYSLEVNQNDIKTDINKTSRTLFPVWFMSYRKNDRIAYATVNGQTGKVVADFPVDLRKFFAFAAGLAVVLFLLFNMVFTLKPSTSIVVNGVLSLISLILYLMGTSKIKARENRTDDKGYQSTAEDANPDGQKAHIPDAYVTKKLPIVTSVIAMGLAVLLFISKSIHDEYYYVCNLIIAVLIGFTLISLIKDYNLLITRRLPQFDKKGGDDRA
ncbi:MAG: hypothetical protein K5888_03640 [Lachnospiraceae bacterium]|nr:hypothetical protein [Lachnospiraceae bacterium]